MPTKLPDGYRTTSGRVKAGQPQNTITPSPRGGKIMNYNTLNYGQQKEFADLMTTWLSEYSEEVIKHVIRHHAENILQNETAMMMLRELQERESKERKDLRWDIESLLVNFEGSKDKKLRLNCLTHAGSYRNVLYDMYIKDMHDEENQEDEG